MNFKCILWILLLFINHVVGEFLQMSLSSVNMSRVIRSISAITITACHMECAKEPACHDIAVTDRTPDNRLPTCYLLKEDNGHYDEGGNVMTTIQAIGSGVRVHGGWSCWRNSTDCTKSCGNGTLKQKRVCDSPKPEYGGDNCTGREERTVKCNTLGCPVNGNFSEWKIASECTVTCGNGTRRLVRECDNPRPTLGGRDCEGEREKVEDCALNECPICYESKDDKPGTIDITKSGKIKSLRLTHVSGYLDCSPTGTTDTRSFWGCGPYRNLLTVITRTDKTIIFPENVNRVGQDYERAASPGSHKEPELLFEANGRDIDVEEGKQLLIWYGQDLKDFSEDNNEGRHCIYVDIEYK